MADQSTTSNLRSVLVSAPGKVILHGEHAVVYGKTAIATSVDLRCYALVLPTTTNCVELELRDMQLSQCWSIQDITELLTATEDQRLQVLKRFCDVNDTSSMKSLACLILIYILTHIVRDKLHTITGLQVYISSQLPFGAGLGSSAAYSACLVTSILTSCGIIRGIQTNDTTQLSSHAIPELLKAKIIESHSDVNQLQYRLSQDELKLINKWIYETEKLIHGTPSGIDNTISVFGGAIKFRSGSFTQLQNMPNLSIVLVYTRVSRSTKRMVSNVKQYYNTYVKVIEPIFESIEEIVSKSEVILEELYTCNDNTRISELYSSLQELFRINHHLLNAIGVGHHSFDKIQHISLEAGLGFKLTGAGGGGCGIILISPDVSNESIADVKRLLLAENFECWHTNIGGEGVAIHCIY